MANGAFTLEGFESPEEVQARIGKAQEAKFRGGSSLGEMIYNTAARGGGQLGGALAGALGYEDPQVKKARNRQGILQNTDLTNMGSIKTAIDNAGDDMELKVQLAGMYKSLKKDEASAGGGTVRPYFTPENTVSVEKDSEGNDRYVVNKRILNRRTGEYKDDGKEVLSEKDPRVQGLVALHKKAGSVRGKEQTEAALDLPKVKSDGAYLTGIVDKITSHKAFSDVVGQPFNVAKLSQHVSGTDAADFKLLQDQLTGQTFMTAYKTLKGGGQITEIEGTKATDSLNRMKTASSEEAYLQAAEEFKSEIKRFERLAEIRSGMSPIDAKLDGKANERATQVATDADGKRVFEINGIWQYSNGNKYGG